jgi:2-C-methyl-D-erythritol 4-phosphate cytidylyltransferase
MNTSVILAAAGSGRRTGAATAKAFLPLGGLPMLVYPLRTLTRLSGVTSVVLVVGHDYMDRAHEVSDRHGPWPVTITIVPGGAERQDSVAAGLATVDASHDLVIVHDAARPFLSLVTAEACAAAAARHGAAIVAVPARDTVKLGDAGVVTQTLDRERIWLAQTPQAFRVALLRAAYAQARRDGVVATDEAALVERLGAPVHIVPGEPANRKITTPDDLEWAEWSLAGRRAAP